MSQSITILTSLITSVKESIDSLTISDSYHDDHHQRITAVSLKLLTRPYDWVVKIKDQDGKRTRPPETLKVLEYMDSPMMSVLLHNLREDIRESLNRAGFGYESIS